MNSLQAPYGVSRSPDIRERKCAKLRSGQPLLMEEDEELEVDR